MKQPPLNNLINFVDLNMIFSLELKMPRRRLLVEVQQLETDAVDDMITRSRLVESLKEGSIGSKILAH